MSGLNQAVEDYLTTRRALGFKLERHGRLLPHLVGYLEHAGAATVTTGLALAWATQSEGHPDESAKRLAVARGFARYLQTLDPNAEVPPADLLPRHRRRASPYLYSDADVAALMAATSTLRFPLRSATYRTLIGLLAVTGIRVGEAIGLVRDARRTLLAVAIQTGLRVSELIGLSCQDVSLRTGAHLRCQGKGRKERCTALTAATVAVLRVWLQERQGEPTDPLFPTSRGGPLSRDAVERLLAKYAALAEHACPSLQGKRLSPHVLRHTSAMQLLQAGVDTTVIALWLGHETIRTTQIYLHADLRLKERALARTAPPRLAPGRYRPPDSLLAFLERL